MKKSQKIRGVLTRLYSFRDRNGNVYTALRYVDVMSGHGICAVCDDNIDHVARQLYPNASHAVVREDVGMAYRDFSRLTAKWPYAGCHEKDIAQWIKKALKAEILRNKSKK